MKQEVVKEMSTADIQDRLVEERKHLTKLKLNHAVSPLENPQVIVESKKTIARMLTELRRRELEEKNNK
ncbi:MAG TPA: 50S ribosomal protein L29 [Bacteroidetes bacterium]|nr:50S ribosomal protein L29 [Bacteroidota bacterium]